MDTDEDERSMPVHFQAEMIPNVDQKGVAELQPPLGEIRQKPVLRKRIAVNYAELSSDEERPGRRPAALKNTRKRKPKMSTQERKQRRDLKHKRKDRAQEKRSLSVHEKENLKDTDSESPVEEPAMADPSRPMRTGSPLKELNYHDHGDESG